MFPRRVNQSYSSLTYSFGLHPRKFDPLTSPHVALHANQGTHYNITDPALIGACFLPSGIGNMSKTPPPVTLPRNKRMTDITPPVGATLSGKMSDRSIVQWQDRRKGVWYPEDRLRVALPAALFVVPLAVLIFGICTEYIPETPGLVITLLCLFMNGLGVRLIRDQS